MAPPFGACATYRFPQLYLVLRAWRGSALVPSLWDGNDAALSQKYPTLCVGFDVFALTVVSFSFCFLRAVVSRRLFGLVSGVGSLFGGSVLLNKPSFRILRKYGKFGVSCLPWLWRFPHLLGGEAVGRRPSIPRFVGPKWLLHSHSGTPKGEPRQRRIFNIH